MNNMVSSVMRSTVYGTEVQHKSDTCLLILPFDGPQQVSCAENPAALRHLQIRDNVWLKRVKILVKFFH